MSGRGACILESTDFSLREKKRQPTFNLGHSMGSTRTQLLVRLACRGET